MTNIKPKVYPAEFKESAIKLAIESKQPFAQRVCRAYYL